RKLRQTQTPQHTTTAAEHPYGRTDPTTPSSNTENIGSSSVQHAANASPSSIREYQTRANTFRQTCSKSYNDRPNNVGGRDQHKRRPIPTDEKSPHGTATSVAYHRRGTQPLQGARTCQ